MIEPSSSSINWGQAMLELGFSQFELEVWNKVVELELYLGSACLVYTLDC